MDDSSFDHAVAKSHREGIDQVGDDVGHADDLGGTGRPSLDRLSKIPRGEDAGELRDGCLTLAKVPYSFDSSGRATGTSAPAEPSHARRGRGGYWDRCGRIMWKTWVLREHPPCSRRRPRGDDVAVVVCVVPSRGGRCRWRVDPAPDPAAGGRARRGRGGRRRTSAQRARADRGGRAPTPRSGAARFSMIGFTWPSGDARLRVRVHTHGRWGSWQRAEPMPDIPDPASEEGRRAARAPSWSGWAASDAVQVESALTPVRGLQMTLIEPGGEPALAVPRTAHQKPEAGRAPRPNLRSRKAWGANERLRSGHPATTGRSSRCTCTTPSTATATRAPTCPG